MPAGKSAVCNYQGDSEKIYPKYYKYFSDSGKLFGLDNTNCNQLLEFELANHVLSCISGVKIEQDVVFFKHIFQDLNEKEKSIVYYLAGYSLSTTYKTLCYPKQSMAKMKKVVHT